MMSLGFVNGAYNHASGTRDAFGALSDALVREGHPRMISKSGDREPQEEIDMFLSRFRPQATGGGPFGDVRWWRNVRYVRFSPLGTVAVPETSNHGRRRSNDLLYPYNSDTPASRRAKQLAVRHNITREGENFGELWHWTFWGPLGTIAAPAGSEPTPIVQEDDMPKIIQRKDTGVTYLIAPGFIHCHRDNASQKVNAAMYGAPHVHNDESLRIDLETHGFAALIDSKGGLSLPAPGVTFIEGPGTKYRGAPKAG